MRTTVTISDPLLDRAKQKAKELGVPLGSVVDQALQDFLTKPPTRNVPIDLPVSPGGQPRAGIDITSNRALYDMLDAAEGERA